MGDVGVVLELGRVVIHISHGHQHAGGAGQSPGEAPVAGHHHQGVVLPRLPVQESAGDDLARRRVDGELGIAAPKPVAVGEGNQGRKIGLVFQKADCCIKIIVIFYTLQTTMLMGINTDCHIFICLHCLTFSNFKACHNHISGDFQYMS